MSFILSALKKVENKRSLGYVPEISSVQVQGFERADNRRYQIGVALSVISIAALAIFAVLWFYKPLLEQNSGEQEMKSVVVVPPVVNDGMPQANQSPMSQNLMTRTPVEQTNITPAMPPNQASPAAPYVVRSNPTAVAPTYYPPQQPTINNNFATSPPAYTPSPQLYQNPTDAPAWEPLPVGIVNYEELPSGLRQRIPNIQLSAHIHSDIRPQARKVIINGVSLREGQRLSDDLTVHQINSDGVILDYQGTLFLLSKTSIFN